MLRPLQACRAHLPVGGKLAACLSAACVKRTFVIGSRDVLFVLFAAFVDFVFLCYIIAAVVTARSAVGVTLGTRFL